MSSPTYIKQHCSYQKAVENGKHHFFGYYNKSNWHNSKPLLLSNQYDKSDDLLSSDLVLEVGYVDMHNKKFVKIGETTTWNWQMGCQLQWLPGQEGNKIIYNIRHFSNNSIYPEFGAKIFDIDKQTTTVLDIPIYSVAPNSQYAITVDYSRLFITHETIGYILDNNKLPKPPLCPDNDGIRFVNLINGTSKLLISYKELSDFESKSSMDKAIHWVSHIEINPSSTCILFLHRWTERVEDETCFLHRLMTINPDGTNLRLLECSDHPLPQLNENFDPGSVGTYDYEKSEYQISHPMWKDDSNIIVWGPHDGSIHYHLYNLDNNEVTVIGKDILTENGHMSFSPTNQDWLLTDTYPDSSTNIRKLLLFNVKLNVTYEIGEFYTPDLKKVSRCDLHPRWSPDGTKVCIDSVHEEERQMYIVDVSDIVG